MVEFLYLQIKMGKITIEDVPAKWLEAVNEKLNGDSIT